MKLYEVREVIDTAPESIWPILTDARAYAGWNDTIVRIEGEIAQGASIKVFSTISPDRAFAVTVTTLEAPNRMVWRGGMPLGLFTGVRTFTLSGSHEGGTEFIMREEFSGLLEPLILRTMPDLTASFIEFAARSRHERVRRRVRRQAGEPSCRSGSHAVHQSGPRRPSHARCRRSQRPQDARRRRTGGQRLR